MFLWSNPLLLKERILQIDNKESMLSDGFEPDLPVKLIIHGFIDTGFEAWVKVRHTRY